MRAGSLLGSLGEKPQCTVLGRGRSMSAPSAVLANGTLLRVLDLNDYLVGANLQSGARGGHPGDNIPVALAAAECAGASGRELLAAILIGHEIYSRGKALMDATTACISSLPSRSSTARSDFASSKPSAGTIRRCAA